MTKLTLLARSAPLLVALAGAAGCTSAANPTEGSTSTTAAAPATATASAAAPPAPPAASAAPPATAAAAAPAPDPAASAAPEAKPAEAPLPEVGVKNIGMHIGGGPNDNVTKAPIHKSVEPHFDEMRRCWTKVEDPKKAGDFGIDLLIDGQGGKAEVSKPRTAIKGDGFKECMVAVYEAIEFLKPRGSKKTKVSYSVRFSP